MSLVEMVTGIYELNCEPVTQIYTGRELGCRCGCHGRYHAKNSIGFKMNWNKAMKLNPEVVVLTKEEYDNTKSVEPFKGKAWTVENSNWIDLNLGNNRTITIYFGFSKID